MNENQTSQLPVQGSDTEWVQICERLMADCPATFLPQFTELMFTGQRLITEARIFAQIDAAKNETLRRLGTTNV